MAFVVNPSESATRTSRSLGVRDVCCEPVVLDNLRHCSSTTLATEAWSTTPPPATLRTASAIS